MSNTHTLYQYIKCTYESPFLNRTVQFILQVIYVARNPKDVAVSYYHFVKMLTFTKYKGEFVDFYNSFIEGKGTGELFSSKNMFSDYKGQIFLSDQ